MRGPARLLLILVLPLITAKFLDAFLTSKPGKKVADKIGMPELSTDEGIDMAQKYAAAGSAALSAAATALTAKVGYPVTPMGPNPKTLSWAAIASDTAELLIATGAMVKVVGDFMKDREELRVKTLAGRINWRNS